MKKLPGTVLVLVVSFLIMSYDVGAQFNCHPTCSTCSLDQSSISCTLCDSDKDRIINLDPNTLSGTCDCEPGYIDDTDPSVNPFCLPCSYTCPTTCQVTVSYCASCTTTTRTLNANNECVCNPGFTDDLTN